MRFHRRRSGLYTPTREHLANRRGFVAVMGGGGRPTMGTYTPVEQGGGSDDGAPTYTGGAGQELIFAGDASAGVYADLTAAAAAPLGSSMRLVPAVSAALGTGDPPAEDFAVVTGKGGVGKAIQNVFSVDAGQPGDKWWLTNAPEIDIAKTIYTSVMVKFDGPTRTEPIVTKFHQQGIVGGSGSDVPQWTLKDVRAPYAGAFNPFTEPDGDKLALFCMDDANYVDDDSAFPDGNDQALQPLGPTILDDWGEYRRVVFVFRPRSTSGNTDAIRDLWITPAAGGADSAKRVLSVRLDSVGVIPSGSAAFGGGAGKQYCGIDMVTGGSFGVAAETTLFQTFGGLSYRGIPTGQQWTLDWNIGDGDPLNPDTMVVWTED